MKDQVDVKVIRKQCVHILGFDNKSSLATERRKIVEWYIDSS